MSGPSRTTPPSAGSGDASGRKFRVGRYYAPDSFTAEGAPQAVISEFVAAAFTVGKTTTFDRIALLMGSVAAGAIRMGIYADDGSGAPGTLLLDAGTVDPSTAGVKEITISQQLTPGLYWIGAVYQGAGFVSWQGRTGPSPFYGHTTVAAEVNNGYTMTSVSGALPASFTIAGPKSTVPKIMLRAA